MNALTWFDNRTILTLESFITATYCVAVFALHRTYPRIRGARPMALAFFLSIFATPLIAARGIIPDFLSIVVGNVIIFLCFLLLVLGLNLFFATRRRITFLVGCAIVAVGACAQTYFYAVENRIVARIVLISCVVSSLRLLMAITVARNARGLFHRRLYAAVLTLSGLLSFSRIPMTLRHGPPRNYMQQNAVQTYYLLGGLLVVTLDGILILTLLSFEITRSSARRAQQDSLTAAYTRRAIEEKLREELARSARVGTTASIFLIDLDHFKAINDTRGHAAGDAALTQVAATITASLRRFDFLGRFGGDEFLVLLPELAIPEALPIAEHIRHNLAAIPTAPTLSIGVAQSDPGESAPSLLARADQALYRAKNDGRNCVRVAPADAALLPTPQSVSHR